MELCTSYKLFFCVCVKRHLLNYLGFQNYSTNLVKGKQTGSKVDKLGQNVKKNGSKVDKLGQSFKKLGQTSTNRMRRQQIAANVDKLLR